MQNEKELDAIVKHLKANLKQFHNSIFPTIAGIYAIGFSGNGFPLASATHIKKGDIIYVGKAETDLKTRDIKTHFNNGKSGSSTLRRTLGAILREQEKLIPIPRSCTENEPSCFTNYKFTSNGEEKLTDWMKQNLSLSYWESQDVENLRKMEPKIIKKLCPIFNIQNNSCNRWKSEIKKLRKCCRELAEKNKNLCK
ncbi:MAG: GIY-YIG nuclease family protein [Pyrinomonadaceae bacterium]